MILKPQPALTWSRWSRAEMASYRDVPAMVRGVVVGSVLMVVLSSNPAWGNLTTPSTSMATNYSNVPENTTNISAIMAPTVTLGLLVIVLAVLGWIFCMVKKKRQTEGMYRPSAEEQSGASSMVAPDALKLTKEERLI